MATTKKEVAVAKGIGLGVQGFFAGAEHDSSSAEKSILSRLQCDHNSVIRSINQLHNKAHFLDAKHSIQHHQYTFNCTLFEYYYFIRDLKMCIALANTANDPELLKYLESISMIDSQGLECRVNEHTFLVRKMDFTMLLAACKQYVKKHADWSTKNSFEHHHGHVEMFAMISLIRQEEIQLPLHFRHELDLHIIDPTESTRPKLDIIRADTPPADYPSADAIYSRYINPLEAVLASHQGSAGLRHELMCALSQKSSAPLSYVQH